MTDLSQDTVEDYVPWPAFLRETRIGALLLICLAVWLHAADSLIVATMLPSIVDEIGGAALVSWTVSIYEIGSIVAGAATALLTMRYGLRAPMCAAALLFGLGCGLSAVSPNMPLVLLGRALQGFGGGGLVAMAFVALTVFFPRRHVARVLAVVSAFWGLSAFLGPLLGGLFVEYANWRFGFGFFGAQALALALWIAVRRGEEVPPQQQEVGHFPLTRLALLCLAVVLISYGGIRVGQLSTPLLIGAGVLSLAFFFWRDGRAGRDRLLPHAPLDPRHAAGATLLMLMCLSMGTIGILAYGPILMTQIHGISALTAGYVVAASSIGWTLTAIAVSGAPERQDRMWIGLGMGLTCLSIAGFVWSVPAGPVWLIGLFAMLEGGGFGLAWTFILRRVTAVTPAAEVQRVSAAIPTVQRMGYALGAAYVGVVANAAGFLDMSNAAEAAEVARILFLASLPLGLIGLAAMVGLLRRHPYDDRFVRG
ncbi:MAG: MFS transporter [Sulfitobacter sp.]|nr:MFS transporter [Sulfitobacter sp.]